MSVSIINVFITIHLTQSSNISSLTAVMLFQGLNAGTDNINMHSSLGVGVISLLVSCDKPKKLDQ